MFIPRRGGRRPELTIHPEDQQPNESINKRQLNAPPSLVQASIPHPYPYRNNYRRGTRGMWRGDASGHHSNAQARSRSGWTQHATRGKKPRQGQQNPNRSNGGWGEDHESQHYQPYSQESFIDTSSRTPPNPSRDPLPVGPSSRSNEESFLSQREAPTSPNAEAPRMPTFRDPISHKPPPPTGPRQHFTAKGRGKASWWEDQNVSLSRGWDGRQESRHLSSDSGESSINSRLPHHLPSNTMMEPIPIDDDEPLYEAYSLQQETSPSPDVQAPATQVAQTPGSKPPLPIRYTQSQSQPRSVPNRLPIPPSHRTLPLPLSSSPTSIRSTTPPTKRRKMDDVYPPPPMSPHIVESSSYEAHSLQEETLASPDAQSPDTQVVYSPVSSKHPLPMRYTQSQSKPTPNRLPIPSQHRALPLPPIKRSSSPTIFAKSATPPTKRQKMDNASPPSIKTEEAGPLKLSTTDVPPPPPSPLIKREQKTPSPSSPPPRRLVKDSCSFFPIPTDCRKSDPNYKKNRQSFFSKEYGVLKNFGLKRTKVIFRDDGMVIEWTSPVPVWSDTLLPEPSNLLSALNATLHANSSRPMSARKSATPKRSTSQILDIKTEDGVITPVSVKSPVPTTVQTPVLSSPAPPLPRRGKLPVPKPPSSTISYVRPASDISPRDEPASESERSTPDPLNRYHSIPGNSISVVRPVEEPAKIRPMAINYLQRYIRAFDEDRASLRHAYADGAMLSLRTHRPPIPGSPRPSGLRTCLGPKLIIDALNTLGFHKFSPRYVAGKVYYDVVLLKSEAGGGVLLTAHGEAVDVEGYLSVSKGSDIGIEDRLELYGNHALFIDQSFILQRNFSNAASKEDKTEEWWPLVATSHQMVVRPQAMYARAALHTPIQLQLEDEFPWLE